MDMHNFGANLGRILGICTQYVEFQVDEATEISSNFTTLSRGKEFTELMRNHRISTNSKS